jgi:CheY-like chemotaxis protein
VNDGEDDDVALRALARAGIHAPVAVAHDGLDALEALGCEPNGTSPTPPRVAFLDLKMPRVDGFEVIQRIRDNPRTDGLFRPEETLGPGRPKGGGESS